MATNYPTTTAHKFLNIQNGRLGVYNAWDTHSTARLAQVGIRYLKRNQQWKYWLSCMEPLQMAVYRMQNRGLLVDFEALKKLEVKVRSELKETDEHILAADPTGDLSRPTDKYPNSLNSNQRLSKFLFETLGLQVPKRTGKGFASTDQETLYAILRKLPKRNEAHRQVLEALFHRTRWATIHKRYLRVPVDDDGRVRAEVKLTGTKTLRFSYKNPALQQAPPETRSIYQAAPGSMLLSVDYNQLEARLLAYLAQDKPSIQAFENGEDVHWNNARDLFGWPPDHLKDKAARNFAKSFLFGVSYGGQAETMKTKLFCPCEKCRATAPPTLALSRVTIKALEQRWFTVHPAVRKFQQLTALDIQRDHFYDHPLGYRRMISAPWGPDLDRETRNLPMQLGGAILMARAQIELDKQQAPIVLQNHDAFILEVPTRELTHWTIKVRTALERPVPELRNVSFPTTVTLGQNWGDYDPLTNPQGLKAA